MSDLLNYKNSDTLVVYGSGYSINSLKQNELKELSKYDSISYNWFCKSKIPTSFYIIREQEKRTVIPNESTYDIIYDLNKNYKKSVLLFVDMVDSGNLWRGRKDWMESLHLFPTQEKYILKEKYFEYMYLKIDKDSEGVYSEEKMKFYCEKMKEYNSISEKILYYSCTMSIAMHFAVTMQYKNIIFVGVDLYDHRYFWLNKNKTRTVAIRKGRKVDDIHKTSNFTCGLIKIFNQCFPDTKLSVHNPKSLLTKYIPIWKK